MRYAREVINLMAAYPGRQFRMAQLVNSIAGSRAEHKERKAVKMGVYRVLQQLQEAGSIEITSPDGRGASALYAWRQSVSQCDKSVTCAHCETEFAE